MSAPDAATPDGEPPEVAGLVIAHLSDTHLTSPGTSYNGVIDAYAALEGVVAVLREAVRRGAGPDLIVVSGDLTDSGDPPAYRHLAETLRPLAERVMFATGNHDIRTTFHREILGVADARQRLQVVRTPQARVVVLDSTVPGSGHGHLDPDHLAALTTELAAPHPGGTVLVLHHPPLPPPSTLHAYFGMDRASRTALARALAGTDVRVILAGHHHLAGSGMLGNIPVVVAGSTAIRTDTLAEPGHERTTRSSGFNVVRLFPDGGLLVSVVPVDGAAEVFISTRPAARG